MKQEIYRHEYKYPMSKLQMALEEAKCELRDRPIQVVEKNLSAEQSEKLRAETKATVEAEMKKQFAAELKEKIKKAEEKTFSKLAQPTHGLLAKPRAMRKF